MAQGINSTRDAEGFTDTQRRIVEYLRSQDGTPKLSSDILEASRSVGGRNVLRTNISNIRLILRPRGIDVICITRREGVYYQLSRLLADPNDRRP